MILLFSVFVLIYFHRVLIMFCLSPITAWATRHHNVLGTKHKSIYTKLADKYCWWFERLFLYWCGNIHSHRIRKFFYKNVHQIQIEKRSLYIPELKYGIHPAYALEKEASSGIMRF